MHEDVTIKDVCLFLPFCVFCQCSQWRQCQLVMFMKMGTILPVLHMSGIVMSCEGPLTQSLPIMFGKVQVNEQSIHTGAFLLVQNLWKLSIPCNTIPCWISIITLTVCHSFIQSKVCYRHNHIWKYMQLASHSLQTIQHIIFKHNS